MAVSYFAGSLSRCLPSLLDLETSLVPYKNRRKETVKQNKRPFVYPCFSGEGAKPPTKHLCPVWTIEVSFVSLTVFSPLASVYRTVLSEGTAHGAVGWGTKDNDEDAKTFSVERIPCGSYARPCQKQ